MRVQPPTLFSLPKKKARAGPIPPAEDLAAYDLLDALWQRCARAVNHSMTQAAWRSRFKTVALDMVRAGVTIERALAAQTAVSLALGRPVFSLRLVQDELARIQSRELGNESATRVVLDDGFVIEGNLSDPVPLADLIQAQGS